jgi:hypothetical protein
MRAFLLTESMLNSIYSIQNTSTHDANRKYNAEVLFFILPLMC